jgi:hypothetical protein
VLNDAAEARVVVRRLIEQRQADETVAGGEGLQAVFALADVHDGSAAGREVREGHDPTLHDTARQCRAPGRIASVTGQRAALRYPACA